jgi:hypothetical protein
VVSTYDVPRRIPRPKDHALIAARIRAGIELGRRGPSPADLGAEVAARAAARAESFDNAPPRRPLNGHTADCPNRLDGRMRQCGLCRAEALGQHGTVVNGVIVPERSALASGSRVVSDPARNIAQGRDQRRHLAAVPDVHPDRPRHPEPEREPELRSCRGCFAPTTAERCPKCEASR